ncbi:hypothetical protein V8C26DRAFT_294707 [Trichoderma gracile]
MRPPRAPSKVCTCMARPAGESRNRSCPMLVGSHSQRPDPRKMSPNCPLFQQRAAPLHTVRSTSGTQYDAAAMRQVPERSCTAEAQSKQPLHWMNPPSIVYYFLHLSPDVQQPHTSTQDALLPGCCTRVACSWQMCECVSLFILALSRVIVSRERLLCLRAALLHAFPCECLITANSSRLDGSRVRYASCKLSDGIIDPPHSTKPAAPPPLRDLLQRSAFFTLPILPRQFEQE